MATTSNGIVYPVASDFVAPLNTHLQNLATSVQSAINTKSFYTPTLNNVTLGNGSLNATSCRSGGLIVDLIALNFGSTTTVSGDISFTLPVFEVTSNTSMLGGLASFFDSSVNTLFSGVAVAYSNIVAPRIENVSGTYPVLSNVNASVPFTWAAGDRISIKTFRMTSN
jgi:hypothetical protein